MDSTDKWEDFSLPGYGDGNFNFKGRLFADFSDVDKSSGDISRLRLFYTEHRKLVYQIVSGSGENKERRVYVLTLENQLCQVDNGRQSLVLPPDKILPLACRLCGLDDLLENEMQAALRESLRLLGAA
jgi:hypothetical protein